MMTKDQDVDYNNDHNPDVDYYNTLNTSRLKNSTPRHRSSVEQSEKVK